VSYHFANLGFAVSPPTLALVALLAAAVIAALSFLVVTPALGETRGPNWPTIVARRRLGLGHPSAVMGGAERTSAPFGGAAARSWVKGVEEPRAVRLGVDLEFVNEDGRVELFADGGRRAINCGTFG